MLVLPALVPAFNYVAVFAGLILYFTLTPAPERTFPILDELGEKAPAAMSLYSFGMTVTGMLIGSVVFVRYYEYALRLVEQTRDPLSETFETVIDPRIKFLMRLNLACAVMGLTYSLFVGLTACIHPHYFSWHLVALSIRLVSGVAYMGLVLWLIARMSAADANRPASALEKPPGFLQKNLLKIRLGVVATTTVVVLLYLVFYCLSFLGVAAVFSYLVNLLFVLFFTSFAVEFRDLSLQINNKNNQYSQVISLQAI